MAGEATDGPGAGASEEIRLVPAVVDDHHVPLSDRGRELGHPALRAEAHLPAAADGQAVGHPVAEVGVARRAQGLDKRAILHIDVDLAQPILAAHQDVHRERVEHLVREDDAPDRRERARHRRPAELAPLERQGLLLAKARRHLDDRRPRASTGLRLLFGERVEQIAHQDPPSCAGLDDVPLRGLADRGPAIDGRSRESPAERGTELRRREEVGSVESDRRFGRVVAVLLVVEGGVHVVGEGDRAAGLDALDQPIAERHPSSFARMASTCAGATPAVPR